MHSGQVETYSDAARRVSDTYRMHRLADPYGTIGQWLAFKLEDGTTDGTLYASKRAAMVFQKLPDKYYAFMQIGPWDCTPKDAETFLALHRKMYEAGIRLGDPDDSKGGREVIKRASREDHINQIRAMFGRGKPSNISYREGN